jgi:gas vesicle protein
MSKIKSLVIGAAVGTFLASTIALLGSKSTIAGKISYEAKDPSGFLSNLKNNFDALRGLENRRSKAQKHFSIGALSGLILGIGTALLLAPKTGRQLRKDLKEGYHDVADKTNEVIHYISQNGEHPVKKVASFLNHKKKAAARTIKRSSR